jgi:uncharacterized protein YjbJ (UPF0337 family)
MDYTPWPLVAALYWNNLCRELFHIVFKRGTRIADVSLQSSSHLKEQQMNWDRMEGNWKQFSGKVKQQWGKLTDDQLTQINGRRDQLIGKIQEAYGIGRDEADRKVKDWEELN